MSDQRKKEMSRIERQAKRIIVLLCILLAHSPEVFAEGSNPKSIRIFPEIQGYWFLDGKLPFGCEVTYTNGGKRRTAGYLNGNLPWRELICESDQAIIHGDELLVDLYKVKQNNNTLRISVRMRDFQTVKAEFELKIPPVQDIRVLLPEDAMPRYGKVIEPFVRLNWVNGASYTYQMNNVKALVPRDSVKLFFNDSLLFDGLVHLPSFNRMEAHSFSLSVVWASRPQMNDTQVYPYIGKEHEVWEFEARRGADAARQITAPTGMDGAEGFHGLPGADASDVKVNLSFNADKSKLIVEASNNNKAYRREFSPAEFSLEIIARGGNGGNGGRGGDGGPAPADDPYRAGIGGKGGKGGRGGKGASIQIESSSDAEAFIPCIIVDNFDGKPGKPGPGGRGGIFSSGYGMPTLLELIFPSRNYDGEPGEDW